MKLTLIFGHHIVTVIPPLFSGSAINSSIILFVKRKIAIPSVVGSIEKETVAIDGISNQAVCLRRLFTAITHADTAMAILSNLFGDYVYDTNHPIRTIKKALSVF